MKIKIIDLLNKVASGKLNDGFKFVDDNGSEWIYLKNVNKLCEINFATDNNVNGLNYNTERIFRIKNLNDEIELIEEEKKIELPEKLEIEQDTPNSNYYIKNEFGTKCGLTKHSKMIADKLNEIIDYLKYKEEEKEK